METSLTLVARSFSSPKVGCNLGSRSTRWPGPGVTPRMSCETNCTVELECTRSIVTMLGQSSKPRSFHATDSRLTCSGKYTCLMKCSLDQRQYKVLHRHTNREVLGWSRSGRFARLLNGRNHARPNSDVVLHYSQPGKQIPIDRLLGWLSIRTMPLSLAIVVLSECHSATSEHCTANAATVDYFHVRIAQSRQRGHRHIVPRIRQIEA